MEALTSLISVRKVVFWTWCYSTHDLELKTRHWWKFGLSNTSETRESGCMHALTDRPQKYCASGHTVLGTGIGMIRQGAYNLAKWNFLSFDDPLKQLFSNNYKEKTRCNELTAAFLQKYRIFYLQSMVTGSTHASHCATQPIYATVTDNYAQNPMPMITLTKIPWV